MVITVNGEDREVRDDLTLNELIAELELRSERVAIELNLDILPRQLWAQTQLHSGDRLEIVHFVGGG
jgi:thiamine biosynthesis protein ThiS